MYEASFRIRQAVRILADIRKKIYETLEELQADLDHWIESYNSERPHSGRYCYGKTPMETFQDSIPIAKQKS